MGAGLSGKSTVMRRTLEIVNIGVRRGGDIISVNIFTLLALLCEVVGEEHQQRRNGAKKCRTKARQIIFNASDAFKAC